MTPRPVYLLASDSLPEHPRDVRIQLWTIASTLVFTTARLDGTEWRYPSGEPIGAYGQVTAWADLNPPTPGTEMPSDLQDLSTNDPTEDGTAHD